MSVLSSKSLSLKTKIPTLGCSIIPGSLNFPLLLKICYEIYIVGLEPAGLWFGFLILFLFCTQYYKICEHPWFCVHYREHILQWRCTQWYWGGQLVLNALVIVAYFLRNCWLPSVFQHNSMFTIYLDWLNLFIKSHLKLVEQKKVLTVSWLAWWTTVFSCFQSKMYSTINSRKRVSV